MTLAACCPLWPSARQRHPMGQSPAGSTSDDRGWQVKASTRQTLPSRTYFATSSLWNVLDKLAHKMSLKEPPASPLENEGLDGEKQEARGDSPTAPTGTYRAHVHALVHVSELAFPDAAPELDALPLDLIVPGCKTGSARQGHRAALQVPAGHAACFTTLTGPHERELHQRHTRPRNALSAVESSRTGSTGRFHHGGRPDPGRYGPVFLPRFTVWFGLCLSICHGCLNNFSKY